MTALDHHLAAQVLVSTWVISADEKDFAPELPTSDGILDKALKWSIEDGAFVDILSQLSFVEGRAGLRCVELSSILNWAQASGMTQDPNPTYEKTQIKISAKAARRTLRHLKISMEDALNWGGILAQKIERAKSEAREYQDSLR